MAQDGVIRTSLPVHGCREYRPVITSHLGPRFDPLRVHLGGVGLAVPARDLRGLFRCPTLDI